MLASTLQSFAGAAQMQLKSSEPVSPLERRMGKGQVRAELWVCSRALKLL